MGIGTPLSVQEFNPNDHLHKAIYTLGSGSDADVTGIGVGSTNVRGNWEVYEYERVYNYEQGYQECVFYKSVTQPSAPVSVYTVQIYFNGQDITNTTQNVIVGQKINLTTVITPSATPTSQSWAVPGNVISKYDVTAQTGGPIPLTAVNNSSVDFYWYDGGNNRQVTYSGSVNNVPFSAHATFNVSRPTASITTTTGTVNIYTGVPNPQGISGTHTEMAFGNPVTFSPPGLRFSRTLSMPSGFTGARTQWVQVFTKKNGTYKSGGTTCFTLNALGLDQTYPYTSSSIASDTPGVVVAGFWSTPPCSPITVATVDYAATMWLMFQPTDRPGTPEWVPLRKVSWAWAATASLVNGTWQVTNNSNSQNPVDADATNYPTWTSVAP